MTYRVSATHKYLALLFAVLMNGACAQMGEGKKPSYDPPSQPPSRDVAPFQVQFQNDGTPVVLGLDGRPLRGTRVRLPRRATQVTRVFSFVGVEAQGSNYLVVQVAPGYVICFDLPHPDGTVGNSCQSPQ